MRLIEVLKNRNYFLLSVISTVVFFGAYVFFQLWFTGGVQNYDAWFTALPFLNIILLATFALLFGLLLSLQVYNFRDKTCDIGGKAGSSSGGVGAMLAFLIPACPACVTWAAFLLPAATAISAAKFLTKYNVYILVVSILILIFGILVSGGFKQE